MPKILRNCSVVFRQTKANCVQKYSTSSTITAEDGETQSQEAQNAVEWNNAVPYSDMPGPKPIPLLGNTWRFMPYVGKQN